MESSLLMYLISEVESYEPIKKTPNTNQDDLFMETLQSLEEKIRLMYPKDIERARWEVAEEPTRKMTPYSDNPELYPPPTKYKCKKNSKRIIKDF
jgi:hypothetical protein